MLTGIDVSVGRGAFVGTRVLVGLGVTLGAVVSVLVGRGVSVDKSGDGVTDT